MTTPFFTDKAHQPTEKEILSAVGRAAGAWRALFAQVRAETPALTEQWRFYTDGNSWLLKAAHKSKTVFWLMVEKGSFRVSFYFPERARDALLASGLSEERKTAIRAEKATGKLRRVSITFGPQRGVKDAVTLIGLKKTIK